MTIDEITGEILDAAIKIHRIFGPGMLESVYERLLAAELQRRGMRVEVQKPISFEYEGMLFPEAFRLDLLVEGKVVVELKSTEKNLPVYCKQVKTYLKVMRLQVGLLVNFGMATLREGFARVVNDFDELGSVLRVNALRASASPREEAVGTGYRSHAELRRGGEGVGASVPCGSPAPNPSCLRASASPRENAGVGDEAHAELRRGGEAGGGTGTKGEND